ncbi:alpha-amylase family glycosyl hydrolase [Paraburkholderia sp. HP33-1]|uniref:alpha-amylase family glycosyl hydrolase n=1 Tax=Paraburkholderia sp. HP33-1 TaxID=2883243 RepID=UPI001F2DF0CA|nr:alpha-amylase family glycosyl hydrolase [Paraburkholderia sp. HP33-1]
MRTQTVTFEYHPGRADIRFSAVRLWGSWDQHGVPSANWTCTNMVEVQAAAGAKYWQATVEFAPESVGSTFRWGAKADGPAGDDVWAIAAEVDDESCTDRVLSFALDVRQSTQIYRLTWCDLLGVQRQQRADTADGIVFSAWAPNARNVSLVLADPKTGYVSDDGTGALNTIAMEKEDGGIWRVGSVTSPSLQSFEALVGRPYMFEIVKDDGTNAFRSDIWSLMQIGAGDFDPQGAHYAGPPQALDGPKSCSVVCDPSRVTSGPAGEVEAGRFWADEFDETRPLPNRIEDLVIYELHVGALGFAHAGPGTLDDAAAFVDHLVSVGVNAVELLPIAEFDKEANWGYGTSHFFAIDQAAGGTDRIKKFVKACHRQGIAVILDVCYNHLDADAERAEWAYDSNDPTRNIYYWYEGNPADYANPSGGYIDNLSSGWAPRFDVEAVRQLFISSAAFLVSVCHVDGFRLDQTSSIHQYPTLHANGQPAGRAAAFGVKFLKQWTRTMRLIKPNLFLCAEDYSGWSALTEPSLAGNGLGFDATWFADFHHNLVEFKDGPQAQLVKMAGYGDDRPLSMTSFAGALGASGTAKVVYNESHDDVGNRDGSARTIVTAVNGAPLIGATRVWAEARVRFAAAMTLLSAGTPMFFMGEEVGAAKPYRYNDFLDNREDIAGLAAGSGTRLFAFYTALVGLSVKHGAFRSRSIEVSVIHDINRIIAFHRWDDAGEFLVIGSLGNAPYESGYWLTGDRLRNTSWREVFNSDAIEYGGQNVSNGTAQLRSTGDALNVVLPACAVVVLQRT